MRIFRVENTEGVGPYTAYGSVELAQFGRKLGRAHGDTEHPCPQADGVGIRYDEVCGLLTRQEVRQWFRGFGKELREHGYTVVELEIHESYVRRGEKQVVFRRPMASVVRTYDPAMLI